MFVHLRPPARALRSSVVCHRPHPLQRKPQNLRLSQNLLQRQLRLQNLRNPRLLQNLLRRQ